MPLAAPSSTHEVAVERLSVRGGRSAAATERLVAAASVIPPGLPPAAVAIVRTLDDPLPGRLDPRAGALLPSREWEACVAGALEERLRGAARPAQGPVPAAAGAVLFADRGELLACLAADWCAGTAWSRWWWRSLPEMPEAGRTVHRFWLEAPEYAPAAVEALAERGLAVAFARRLAPPIAADLVAALARVFGLSLEPAETARLPAADEAGGADAEPDRRPGPAQRAPPPWGGLVPEAAEPGLREEQRLLLGLSLALRRDPGLPRTRRFTRALARWSAEVPSAREEESATGNRAGTSPVDSPPPADESGVPRTARRDGDRPPEPAPGRERRARGGSAGIGVGSVPERAESVPAPPAVERSATDPPRVRTDSSGRRLTFAPPAERASALAGVTELGGLFYLVNVALFLELYGDFTTVNRGIALDPWDFVALVGSELLGGTDDDRAWGMLDELAARPGGTRAGHGFRAPRTWRLDSAWLEPFADDKRPWRAVTTGGRLRVLHPAAFAVLDLPPADDPAERLRRELRRYGEPRIAPVAHGAGNHRRPGRDRWVGWITDYVRARLALALGVAAPEVPDLLLRRRARVLASPARVDVVFRLDDLPIEIRLAGLDRDPGWVPAAGRHIALHFD